MESKALCGLALAAMALFALIFVSNVPFGFAQSGTSTGGILGSYSTSWNIQVVAKNAARGGYGQFCPIAVDSQDNPHIAYTAPYTDSKVTYASLNGSVWIIQAIASGDAFSLGIDTHDLPHILHNGLTYSSWTGSNWTIQTVDSSGEIPYQLSLSLDQNNTPYIMYGSTISVPSETGAYWHLEEVKLATLQDSNWRIQAVADTGGFGNMVLDSEGYPHLIYQVDYPENTYSNSSLVYASWNGTAWDAQTVVSGDRLVNVGFLALDSHGFPHIAFVDVSTVPEKGYVNFLRYASWDGSAWSVQTVGSNYAVFGPCFLALDSKGNPHLSFTGAPAPPSDLYYQSAYLLYATANEPTPSPASSPSSTPTTSPSSPAASPSIPEFPSWVILPFLIAATTVALAYAKKKKAKNN